MAVFRADDERCKGSVKGRTTTIAGSFSQVFVSSAATDLRLDESLADLDEEFVCLDEEVVLLDANAVLLEAPALLVDDDDGSAKAGTRRRATTSKRDATMEGDRRTDVVVSAANTVRRGVTAACRDDMAGGNDDAFRR